jgi:hypothetical protein
VGLISGFNRRVNTVSGFNTGFLVERGLTTVFGFSRV